MFYCENCDSFFEEAKTVMYQDLEIGHQSHIEVCPFCKNDYFEEVKACEKCGKNFCKSDLDEGLCKNCVSELIKTAQDFISSFTDREKEIIIEYLTDI